MKEKRKTVIFVAVLFVLAIPLLYEIGYGLYYSHLSRLTIVRIGVYPWDRMIPLKRKNAATECVPRVIQLAVRENNLSYSLVFFEKTNEIRIHGAGWTPSGKGILAPCYAIANPEIEKQIIDFLMARKEILFDHEIYKEILCFIGNHRTELAKLGDGDPYIGLERAGVAEWIKAGKDPEAEWRKKYPAEEL